MAERRQEMSKLYGSDSAPMILGMETAMQLTFDRFVGKHQPKHWPNIPLNL
jgi:gem associated protein 8